MMGGRLPVEVATRAQGKPCAMPRPDQQCAVKGCGYRSDYQRRSDTFNYEATLPGDVAGVVTITNCLDAHPWLFFVNAVAELELGQVACHSAVKRSGVCIRCLLHRGVYAAWRGHAGVEIGPIADRPHLPAEPPTIDVGSTAPWHALLLRAAPASSITPA
jgi:hypothetical protein